MINIQHSNDVDNGVIYSGSDFSVVSEDGLHIIKPKISYGRIMPFIKKNGVIEGILLPKEDSGLLKYLSKGLNELNDAVEYCKTLDIDAKSDAFIHLGFWRSSEYIDDSECVWGLDCNYDENTSKLIGDRNLVVVPLGFITTMGDSIAAAALLKLIVVTFNDLNKTIE